jgi:2,4-dienoyl-CoA reductase (NADPH2)
MDAKSKQKLDKLFEPIMIKNVEVRNRIKVTAMAVAMTDKDGTANDQMVSFYEERARGGAGLIGISCTPSELVEDPMIGLYDDKFIPGLKRIVDAIHKHGAKAYAQMGVGYAYKFPGEPVQYYSPSGFTATGRRPGSSFRLGGPFDQEVPIALTKEQIKQIIEDYGDGAKRAKEAGFDIIEIIPAVGYLLAQFMSPIMNKRTDEYGGSLENRMRIVTEVIKNIKDKTGNMPVAARMSGDDMYPVGPKKHYGHEEAKQHAQIMEKAGIDHLCIMAGWHSAPVAMIQTHVPQGRWLYLATGIKSVVKVPVAGGTQLQDIMLAADAVATGKTDMVFMARANIADPEISNKAKKYQVGEIRPCINCCRCQESSALFSYKNPNVYCSVNPRVGREAEYPSAIPEPAKIKKKVLVIGGGPSGMEAARVAALKGHNVTLVEKNGRLGGAMLMGSIANEKLGPQMKFKIREIQRLPIKVMLQTEATPELVDQMKPDAVVVAVGGKTRLPDAPGIDKPIVRGRSLIETMFGAKPDNKKKEFMVKAALPLLAMVNKFYYNPDLFRKLIKFDFIFFKKKNAILGGGFAGLEMGELLSNAGKKVTALIEEGKEFGADIGPIHRWVFKKEMKDHNVPMLKQAKVLRINDDSVDVQVVEEKYAVEADTVIPTQINRNSELYDKIKDKVKEIYFTGDANSPGKLMEAITSGFIAGSAI